MFKCPSDTAQSLYPKRSYAINALVTRDLALSSDMETIRKGQMRHNKIPTPSTFAIVVENHRDTNYLSAAGGTDGYNDNGGMNGAWLSFAWNGQAFVHPGRRVNWLFVDGHVGNTARRSDWYTFYPEWFPLN